MLGLIVIILSIILSFVHYFFNGEQSWYVGWSANDFIIMLLAMGWVSALEWYERPKLKAVIMLYALWRLLISIYNIIDWSPLSSWVFISIEAIIFLAWMLKTLSLLNKPKVSDPYYIDHYMIGLASLNHWLSGLNLFKPTTVALTGGRMMIGGGYAWGSRGGRYKKIRIQDYEMFKDFVFIDTGIPISEERNKRLDYFIGRRNFYIFRNCNSLSVGENLSKLLRNKNRNS